MADTRGVCLVADGGRYRLRILATSDLHAHVLPYDYANDRTLPDAGLARVAVLIRQARAAAENSITLDNGDFLEGNPLGRLLAQGGQLGPRQTHPVIAAMNAVGYDAVGLGNHEFSYGLDFLERALGRARFPVLSSNIARRLGTAPTDDVPFVSPSLILERRLLRPGGPGATIRIGLLSLLPPQLEIWEERHLGGRIRTRDIVYAARAWVADLRARGADLVIALCHSGIGGAEHQPMMENAAIPVAAIDGIDVVVAGHTHTTFPGPDTSTCTLVDAEAGRICGKPAVKAGYRGSHLGIIDLDLEHSQGRWISRGAHVRAEPVAHADGTGRITPRVALDRPVERAAARLHRATIDHVRQPIGHTDEALHSYFSRVAPSAALDLVHAAQIDWAERSFGHLPGVSHLPVISAASPIRCGGRAGPAHFTDIPAGPLRLRHVHELYGFPNVACAMQVTGRTLRHWLERSARQFLTLDPSRKSQPLLDPEAPGYAFDTTGGASWSIDITRQDARIRDLSVAGHPVTDQTDLLLITHCFRTSTGSGFLDGSELRLEAPPILVSDLIADFLSRGAKVSDRHRANWRLTGPAPGASAWFDTGPGARAHLEEAGRLGIAPLTATPEGFLRCLVRF